MGLGRDLFKEWPCQLRINKYSFAPETVGSSGVQFHTDSGFLTILQDEENVGGLEVMDKTTGAYVPVDPMPGSLLVNLGDVATGSHTFSHLGVEQWKILQKQEYNAWKEQYAFQSLLFMLGPKQAAVEAPPELVDDEHPRLYVPITFEEYRKLGFPLV
ncbi:hypothetical protein Acr_23g0007250 [Actinidia rufa]|uniref:Isopenicillin N synthase-like Fe(2+) 2OG dioxygenase domain-containing protein n=1 Tax=Actinidia rufa TaxID=165716 RepID=A0A7J0GNG6_9ERIC|nr:hypothetical protein Acr_23g0007250 [Actinidia rufa]